MSRRSLATVCCLVLPCCANAAEPSAPRYTVIKATPAPEWDLKFAAKDGWIGGDGVYSVNLGQGRILWLFGDTILGAVKDGKRVGATMVNNTIALQSAPGSDGPIRFLSGKPKDGKPTSFLSPADGTGWFWPQAAVKLGNRLYLFLPQFDRAKDPGPFGFKAIGQWLAVVENPDDDLATWRISQDKIPFAEFGTTRERSWGSAALLVKEFVYVYGFDQKKGTFWPNRTLIVARAPAGKLTDFKAWRFKTADGWSDKTSDSVALADGVATEFSVSPMPAGEGYVAVYSENGLSDRIVARFADDPAGPWSAPLHLYTAPEQARDKGLFCYAGKAHPWAASGRELVVSYCTNAWEFGRLFRDEKVYRPKFVRVELGKR